MLRVYFVQEWFNLSDPGVEEALYESAVLRRFVGVDLGVAPAPDGTIICRFRRLLEKHELGGQMVDAVNHHLERQGNRSHLVHFDRTFNINARGVYAGPQEDRIDSRFFRSASIQPAVVGGSDKFIARDRGCQPYRREE